MNAITMDEFCQLALVELGALPLLLSFMSRENDSIRKEALDSLVHLAVSEQPEVQAAFVEAGAWMMDDDMEHLGPCFGQNS